MFGMNIVSADSLMLHNGMQFSTRDKDHDRSTFSCSVRFHGSWWYRFCHYVNLNGRYYKNGEKPAWAEGITWKHWKSHNVSLKSVTMQMRPARFSRGEEFSLHGTLLSNIIIVFGPLIHFFLGSRVHFGIHIYKPNV